MRSGDGDGVGVGVGRGEGESGRGERVGEGVWEQQESVAVPSSLQHGGRSESGGR